MRYLRAILTVSLPPLLLAPAVARNAADESPSRDVLREQAKRCKQILKTSIIDFYLPAAVDRTNGGYQGAYHNGRSMLLCAKMVEELAEKAGADQSKP
jgi:hypothetical protein